ERAILLRERVRHVNRIKGLLSSQGITDFEPLHKDRRIRLDALRTGDGRPLPPRLKAELLREIELIELLLLQIAEVETERDSAAEFGTAQIFGPLLTAGYECSLASAFGAASHGVRSSRQNADFSLP